MENFTPQPSGRQSSLPPELVSPASELNWLAFLYTAGELPSDAEAAFEARLAVDQSAREAVAAAVDLQQGVTLAIAEPVSRQPGSGPPAPSVAPAALPVLLQPSVRPITARGGIVTRSRLQARLSALLVVAGGLLLAVGLRWAPGFRSSESGRLDPAAHLASIWATAEWETAEWDTTDEWNAAEWNAEPARSWGDDLLLTADADLNGDEADRNPDTGEATGKYVIPKWLMAAVSEQQGSATSSNPELPGDAPRETWE